MRSGSIIIPMLLAGLYGCTQSAATGPADEVSCNGRMAYFFASNNAWLWTTASLYDISNPSDPLPHSQSGGQYGGDTAFIVDTNLYIENNSSVSISRIGSQVYPQYESLTGYPRHLAYSPGHLYFLRHKTYAGGNQFCWQASDSVNELVVDAFSDTLYAAIQLAKVPLSDPTDLAISDTALFILDGSAGLKIFSISNPAAPTLIATAANVQGYHLQFTDQSTLLVSTSEGLEQYDVSNTSNPVLLSKIE